MYFKHLNRVFTLLILCNCSVVHCYSQVRKQFETVTIQNETISNSKDDSSNAEDAFLGIYSDCILHLSYTCLQKKTLMYLNKLNNQREFPIVGSFLSFVKMENTSSVSSHDVDLELISDHILPSPRLSQEIDTEIENFFDNRILRLRYGNDSTEDIEVVKMLQIVEGRKKKGDGSGGGGDSGKKKMMMMAMMCMKMKMMMMIPAMMGMMGIMSLKGILLGSISLLISKILLIMKLMGGSGGGGGKGGQGGGGSHGGSDSMWMPAAGGGWNAGGAQDSYGPPGGGGGGGGAGGGYNSNGEWQSRSGREILRLLPSSSSRDVKSMNRRKREMQPIENVPNIIKYTIPNNKNDLNVDNVEFSTVKRPKRWLYNSSEDDKTKMKNRHRKPLLKEKKKKGHKKHKKTETINSYMEGMKNVVEDNLWE